MNNDINYLDEFFSKIKDLKIDMDDKTLHDKLMNLSSNAACNDYHINYKYYNKFNLSVISSDDVSDTLKHSDDLTDKIVNNCNLIILNTFNMKPIVSLYNKPHTTVDDLEIVNQINKWSNVEVTKYCLNAKHIALFYHCNEWYISSGTNIVKLLDVYDIFNKYKNFTDDELCDASLKSNILFYLSYYYLFQYGLINDNIVNPDIDQNYVYHFLLKHNSLRKYSTYSVVHDTGLTLLWICDTSTKLSNNNDNYISTIVPAEKKVYFSCIDELLTSLDVLNHEYIVSKNIQYGGYFVNVLSNNGTKYTNYVLFTDIYKHILATVPTGDNNYKNFLELYQHDKLGNVVSYLHKYPADVINRINSTVKTLSREILNIYHLTRNKKNSELYLILTKNYTNVLFDLHEIYIQQRYGEFIIQDDCPLKEKKSVSINIVYNYLKSLDSYKLIELFKERSDLVVKLINTEFESIMSVSSIDILVQTELMFGSSKT